MSPQPAAVPRLSAEDYLAQEQRAAEKHEFIRGEVFAMAGASDAHVTTAGNLFAAIRAHLRGGPCRAFIADMKLRVQATDAFFYPDVFVLCAEPAPPQPQFKTDATLIVEVLSPATEAFDRGAKFAHYRHLPGLREYALADPATRTLDLYRIGEGGLWTLHPYAGDDVAEFASIGLRLSLAEVFEGVSDHAVSGLI
jgi:Uma2 family endonuclease